MAFTHSVLPPDARVGQNFEIIRGTDANMMRTDKKIGDVTNNNFTVMVGEVLRYIDGQTPQDTAYKVDHNSTATGAEIVGVGTTTVETDEPAGISFDSFNSEGIIAKGFPDAWGRGAITLLNGSFIVDLKTDYWFVDDALDLDNGTAVPGILSGTGACLNANFLAVEAGRRVIAIKPSDAYGATRCAFATLPLNYTLAYGAPAVPIAAEVKRDFSAVGKILKVYTGDDGLEYASVHFKFSGKWF